MPDSASTRSRHGRQIRHKRRHLCLAELARVPLPMKDDEAPDPGDIRLLSSATVMADANAFANAIEQFRFRALRSLQGRVVGFCRAFIWLHSTTMASSLSCWQCRAARRGVPNDTHRALDYGHIVAESSRRTGARALRSRG